MLKQVNTLYFALALRWAGLNRAKNRNDLPLLTQTILHDFIIPLPPTIAEQEAIAGALSDADQLIGSLEQLVAKKRRIKQGVIQELLTGQKRLPDFTGEWQVKRLGELGSFLKGSGVSKSQALSGSLPCIRYGEIYTRHNEYIRSFYSWISTDIAATATRLRRGDILFASSGETKEDIGKCVSFIDDIEAYAGGDIVILRTERMDPMFLGFYLNTSPIARQKASKGQGDAVVHISGSALAQIRGRFPQLAEQSAIAAILSDIGAEIEGLEAKLAKVRRVKQGMMQELLTGRIRLIQPAKTEAQPTGHNWAFNEAVVISVLAKSFGSEQYPLGRKRYTKLSYLLHRHHEDRIEGYLKKAAGPYNPATRYKGPEAIAVKNGYVRKHTRDQYSGFVADAKIADAEVYFRRWYGDDALTWLEQFRRVRNDDLELLATVDMAVEDLRREEKTVDLAAVKVVICNHPEWEAKLERDTFSDLKIARAIEQCGELFGRGG